MKKLIIIIAFTSCTKQSLTTDQQLKHYSCWANIPTTGKTITVDTMVVAPPIYLYDIDGNKGKCNCELK